MPVIERASVIATLPRALGRTGLSVFPVGLGAMALSMRDSAEAEDAPAAVIRAALDAGVISSTPPMSIVPAPPSARTNG